MSIIKLYNHCHLGDNIFSAIYFNNIKEYIETNNIIIHYYIKDIYITQVNEFITSKNIFLYPLTHTILNNPEYICIWIGTNNYNIHNTFLKYNNKFKFNDFLVSYFNQISMILNIPLLITDFKYNDIDLLHRYNNLSYLSYLSHIDILIINSYPFSNQYLLDEDSWNKYILELNKKYKIITTKKVDNVNCTTDIPLSIKNIAAISTNSKVIIAINTGPITGIFNEYTLKNVRQVYIFDNSCFYTYDKFKDVTNINDITENELNIHIYSDM